MPDLLSGNAYHVLGLPITAGSKEIQRRAKEILARLKIEDHPAYDLDFGLKNFRTEEAVKDALRRLSSPRTRIREFFFWFEIRDSHDEEARNLIRAGDLAGAAGVWERLAREEGRPHFGAQKNLALLSSLRLFLGPNPRYLEESLELWGSLVKSSQFWSYFRESYRLHDELDTSQEIFENFREHVTGYLSDLYTEIADQTSDRNAILEFQRRFATIGERLEKDVLSPIYGKIRSIIEEMDGIAAGDPVTGEHIQRFRALIPGIRDELNTIKNLGVYEESEAIALRDTVAGRIRSFGVLVNNRLNDQETALEFTHIALSLSGTESFRNSLNEDIRNIAEIRRNRTITRPVLELIEKKRYQEGIELINGLKGSGDADPSLLLVLDDLRKTCLTGILFEKYQLANRYFNNRNFTEAAPLYQYLASAIKDNVGLYSFERRSIEEFEANLIQNMNFLIAKGRIHQLGSLRSSVLAIAKKHFEGKYEQDILVILADSLVFLHLYQRGLYRGASQSTSCCFVITATLGDRNHPHVLLLQRFRDGWLLHRGWGRACNTLYETVGPVLAGIIRKSRILQDLSRILIVGPGVFVARRVLGPGKDE
jgi:hypothetical protein